MMMLRNVSTPAHNKSAMYYQSALLVLGFCIGNTNFSQPAILNQIMVKSLVDFALRVASVGLLW